MSEDASDWDAMIAELFTLSLGPELPLQVLLRTGAFPDGWVERYLDLLARVEVAFGDADSWPRRLTAAVYSASAYCPKRYADWQRLGGGTNERTEHDLQSIRWAGDKLLVGPFYREMDGG